MLTRRFSLVALVLFAAGCASETSSDESTGATSDEVRVCASGSTLRGIDVSYYQGSVDWAKVKSSGRAFAFARVSDGTSHIDSKFSSNWPKMKSAGLTRGAYQFFRPARDPSAQAQVFLDKLAAAGGLRAGDLPPVLDLETSDGVASSTVVARAKTWLNKVQSATGIKPIIYTGRQMENVLGTSFSLYYLWVANYGVSCPGLPRGWTSWKFWQSSQTGSVSGVSGPVDLDTFNGSSSALAAITKKGLFEPEPGPTMDPPGEITPFSPEEGQFGATLGHPFPDTDSTDSE